MLLNVRHRHGDAERHQHLEHKSSSHLLETYLMLGKEVAG